MFAWILIAFCGLSLADAASPTTAAQTTAAPTTAKPTTAAPTTAAPTTAAPTTAAPTTAAPTTAVPTTSASTTAAETANNDNQTRAAIITEDHDQNQEVVETPEMISNPCKNGGTLTEDVSCDCKPGYFGKKCEVDLTDCFSNLRNMEEHEEKI